jgi:hypothetical protein
MEEDTEISRAILYCFQGIEYMQEEGAYLEFHNLQGPTMVIQKNPCGKKIRLQYEM